MMPSSQSTCQCDKTTRGVAGYGSQSATVQMMHQWYHRHGLSGTAPVHVAGTASVAGTAPVHVAGTAIKVQSAEGALPEIMLPAHRID